jgi:hypothetical protein
MVSLTVALPGWCYDGNALLQDCGIAVKQYDSPSAKKADPSAEDLVAERCRSYIWGATTVLRTLQLGKDGTRLLCVPATVRQEQAVRVVAKWLKDNPAKLHFPAEFAAVVALREAFPCPKKVKASGNAAF